MRPKNPDNLQNQCLLLSILLILELQGQPTQTQISESIWNNVYFPEQFSALLGGDLKFFVSFYKK
jgi:hypothetical protein